MGCSRKQPDPSNEGAIKLAPTIYRFAKSTFYDVVPEHRPPPCLWRSKNQVGLLVAPLPRSSTVAPEAGREE
jgi:hypothetical protein